MLLEGAAAALCFPALKTPAPAGGSAATASPAPDTADTCAPAQTLALDFAATVAAALDTPAPAPGTQRIFALAPDFFATSVPVLKTPAPAPATAATAAPAPDTADTAAPPLGVHGLGLVRWTKCYPQAAAAVVLAALLDAACLDSIAPPCVAAAVPATKCHQISHSTRFLFGTVWLAT